MTTTVCVPIRLLAAVSPFMAKGDVRYYLNGMFLEPMQAGNAVGVRAVATDGHVLGIATDASASWDVNAKPVIIPRSMIEDILKGQNKAVDVVLKFCKSEVAPGSGDNAGDEIVAEIGNRKLFARAIDGRFPDYQSTVPRGDMNNCPATFNPELVERFVKSAKLCGKYEGTGRYCAMQLRTNGPDRAAIIAVDGTLDGFQVGGVIMPLRSGMEALASVLALLPPPPVEEKAAA